ncbi:MAG: hypothetical protein H6879_02290 [Rhodobiaceae bacterium]|nr:hypothetical protein [Rhodobiaceae bacterium]
MAAGQTPEPRPARNKDGSVRRLVQANETSKTPEQIARSSFALGEWGGGRTGRQPFTVDIGQMVSDATIDL